MRENKIQPSRNNLIVGYQLVLRANSPEYETQYLR